MNYILKNEVSSLLKEKYNLSKKKSLALTNELVKSFHNNCYDLTNTYLLIIKLIGLDFNLNSFLNKSISSTFVEEPDVSDSYDLSFDSFYNYDRRKIMKIDSLESYRESHLTKKACHKKYGRAQKRLDRYSI